MNGYHYISYEPDDGRDFALWLAGELGRGNPSVKTWLDEVHMRDTGDFSTQAGEALQACTSLILILTPKAAGDGSRVNEEWKRALRYKKPITIVIVVDTVPQPNRLESRQSIDFSKDRQAALGKLMLRLSRLTTVEGKLDTLKEQLTDAQRDRTFAPPQFRQRIDEDIAVLNQQINDLSAMIADPAQVESRLDARIASGLERDRRPIVPPRVPSLIRFVNPPPGIAPSYFQNRFVETKLVVDFLKDDTKSLLMITGKGGVGKTALVCRLLKSLEQGVVPDSEEKLLVGGIIYMNQIGSRQITATNLFADLLLLIHPELRKPFEQLLQNEQATIQYKLKAILPTLPSEPVVILMDNFEDLVNRDSRNVNDQELVTAITVLLQVPQHTVKIILTTRIPPQDFVHIEPARQMTLDLDEGLESPYAENILREMDTDGHAGLRDAEGAKLTQLRDMTRGFPRALEAVYAILSADRDTTVDDLLAAPHPPEHIIRLLVGEAFSRLNETDQRVMQALAIFGNPVSTTAVDFLLKPWFPHIDSGLSLKRLVNMHLVRKETGLYYLHPLDREHALKQLLVSSRSDALESLSVSTSRGSHLASELTFGPFRRLDLTERAADYYREISVPRDEWTSLDDVVPQIREFHLRLDAGDDQTAGNILETVSSFILKRGGFEKVLSLASRLSEHARSTSATMQSLSELGQSNWRMGRLKAAIEAQKKLLKLAEETGDPSEARIARGNLFIIELDHGDYRKCLRNFEELLAFFKHHPWDRSNRATLHHLKAFCLEKLGYLDKAAANDEQSLTLARETGELDRIEGQTHNLASAKETLGHIQEAKGLYKEALKMAEESKNPLWKANHVAAMAGIYDDLGRSEEALKCIDQAIKLHTEIGDLKSTAEDLKDKAAYLMNMGEVAGATEAARTALQQALDLGVRLESYQEVMAEICLFSGNTAVGEQILAECPDQNFEESNWHRLNLHGIASLKQGAVANAKLSFAKALSNAEEWLKRCDKNHKAWSAKGLAIAGLFIVGETIKFEESRHAYRMAHDICQAKGIVARRLRLFTILSSLDNSKQLAKIASSIQHGHATPDKPAKNAKVLTNRTPDSPKSRTAMETPVIRKPRKADWASEQLPRKSISGVPITPSSQETTSMKQKVLFLAANPTNETRLALDEECRQIDLELQKAEHRIFDLIPKGALREDDLQQHLLRYSPHIVHFSGHGSNSAELILVDDNGEAAHVGTDVIKELFAVLKDNVRVVVLNACFSHTQAEAITTVIDCAVGMNQAIGDKAAIAFSTAFYRALGYGRSVKTAFDLGVNALRARRIREQDTPVLLARDGVNPVDVYLVKLQDDKPPALAPRPSVKPAPEDPGPRLMARFQELNGKLRLVRKDKCPAYWMDLWVEEAPKATKSVAFELLDVGFEDRKWTVARSRGANQTIREFLTDEMNSYGDVEILAHGIGPKTGKWNIKSTLYEALKRYYGSSPKGKEILRALKQIRDT